MKKLFAILFLFAEVTCFAQNSPALTVERIMSDYKWMGISPYNVQWDQNSRYVYFNWNPKGAVRDPLYQVGVGNFEAREAADTTKRMVTKGPFVYSSNRSKVLFERNGDIILQDLKSGQETTLVATLENETNPVFNLEENKVFFQQGDNLFSVSLSGGMFTQLTNLTRNKAGMEKGLSRQDAWLKEDQRALFDIIKKQDRDQKLDTEDRVLLSPKRPKPFYLEEKAVVSSLSISPNGRYVYFRITRQPESSRNIIVPNYVTGSGYTEDIPGRTKVGAAAPINDSYIRDTQTDSVYAINTRNLPGIKNLPEYLKEYPLLLEERTKKNEDRRVTIGNPIWNADGSRAVLNIVSQDNKDRWIVALDPLSGPLLQLDHQHDEAWIGGPGIATSAGITNLNWIDDHTVYFQSEATGYSHLYTVDVSSGVKKQLTAGNYEVLTLRLSNDKKVFYFTANIEHPGITHFYRLPVTGGTPVQLTSMKGGNEVLLSPDERWLAIRYSYTTKPWELYLQENKPGPGLYRSLILPLLHSMRMPGKIPR